MSASLHCKEVNFSTYFFVSFDFEVIFHPFLCLIALTLAKEHAWWVSLLIGFSLMTLSLMRCEPSIANLNFLVSYLTPIEESPAVGVRANMRKESKLADGCFKADYKQSSAVRPLWFREFHSQLEPSIANCPQQSVLCHRKQPRLLAHALTDWRPMHGSFKAKRKYFWSV